jgi:hypothetical protein
MRCASLILIATTTLLSNGCAALIARSGEHLGTLTTREKVHEKFGEPLARGTVEEQPREGYPFPTLGLPFEEFRTRRKIAEPSRSASLGMSAVMTFGLGELIMFPYELYLLGNRTLLGQDIRFVYDSAGTVTHYHLAGEWHDCRSCLYSEPGHSAIDSETTVPPQSRAQR